MTSDPVRLLDDPDAPPTLRSDVSISAEVDVEGLNFAAGLLALQRATTAGVTSSTAAVAGTSLLLKLGIGASVLGGVVALWLGLGGPEPTPAGDRRAAGPAVTMTAQPEPTSDLGSTTEKTGAEKTGARPEPTPTPVEPTPTEPAPTPVEPMPTEPAPALAVPSTAAPVTEPKPAASSVSRRKPSKAAGSADDVLREAKLVATARSNLAREPARALALAEEAERDFPRGQLVEERKAIAIRALVALGRLDEAQRRAEPFLAEYGRGAHAAAVRRALAGEPDEP